MTSGGRSAAVQLLPGMVTNRSALCFSFTRRRALVIRSWGLPRAAKKASMVVASFWKRRPHCKSFTAVKTDLVWTIYTWMDDDPKLRYEWLSVSL